MIKGVPGTGSRIDMYFEDPAGSKTGKLFPTGQKRDFDVPGYGPAEVTVLDCSNPMVFIKASDLGIKGTELVELNQNADVMEHIERIRGMAAVKCGFVENGKMPERNLLLHQRYPLYQRLRITQIWTKIK